MKRIVFICEANSIRSQLAEGLARYFWLGRNVHVESAGSCNGGGVNYFVKTVLQEMKIDCSLQHSKSFKNIIDPESVDVVVILCTATKHKVDKATNAISSNAFRGEFGVKPAKIQ